MGRVVAASDLEIRQDAVGRLFASDYYVAGESPEDRAASTLALIRRRFRGADTVTPVDARIGWRPMPADGMPIVGFTPDAPGLYLAVMHAGVVMAPSWAGSPPTRSWPATKPRHWRLAACPASDSILALVAGAPRSCGRPHDIREREAGHADLHRPRDGRAETDAISMAQVLSTVVRRRIVG